MSIVASKSKKVNSNYLGGVPKRGQQSKLRKAMVTAIKNGSDEQAYDLLKVMGWKGTSSPEEFCDIDSIARFYGVEKSYLKSMFTREKLTKPCHPDMVRRAWKSPNVYSPRLALASACLMLCGRTVPANSVANKVGGVLAATAYYDDAREILAGTEEIEPENVEMKASALTNIEKAPELIADTLKKLGVELTEIANRFAGNGEDEAYKKKVDKAVELCKSKKLSISEAVLLTGIPKSTLYFRATDYRRANKKSTR